MRMSVIDGHTPRLFLLSPTLQSALPDLPRTGDRGWCQGCGLMLPTEYDAALHFVIPDGQRPSTWATHCPRWLLAEPGMRTGDSIIVLRNDHVIRLFIHGLSPDGSPRIWSGSAQHQDECGCCRDCHAPVGHAHSKDCPLKTRWEIEQ